MGRQIRTNLLFIRVTVYLGIMGYITLKQRNYRLQLEEHLEPPLCLFCSQKLSNEGFTRCARTSVMKKTDELGILSVILESGTLPQGSG